MVNALMVTLFAASTLACEGSSLSMRSSQDEPIPTITGVPAASVSCGSLQIRTRTFPGSHDDVPRALHSGYTLSDSLGKHVQFVPNHRDRSDEWPSVIELPRGRYLVTLADPGRHPPKFWVEIVAGEAIRVDTTRCVDD